MSHQAIRPFLERQHYKLFIELGQWHGFLCFDSPVRTRCFRFQSTQPQKPPRKLRASIQSCRVRLEISESQNEVIQETDGFAFRMFRFQGTRLTLLRCWMWRTCWWWVTSLTGSVSSRTFKLSTANLRLNDSSRPRTRHRLRQLTEFKNKRRKLMDQNTNLQLSPFLFGKFRQQISKKTLWFELTQLLVYSVDVWNFCIFHSEIKFTLWLTYNAKWQRGCSQHLIPFFFFFFSFFSF